MGRIGWEVKQYVYKEARRNLKLAIQQSKSDGLKPLCLEVDMNRKKSAYMVVMGRFRGRAALQSSYPKLPFKLFKVCFRRRARAITASRNP